MEGSASQAGFYYQNNIDIIFIENIELIFIK